MLLLEWVMKKKWSSKAYCKVSFLQRTQTDAEPVDVSKDSEDKKKFQNDSSEKESDEVIGTDTVSFIEGVKYYVRTLLLHLREPRVSRMIAKLMVSGVLHSEKHVGLKLYWQMMCYKNVLFGSRSDQVLCLCSKILSLI